MGKYCSNSQFMEVKPANNSSHGWQSILIGRDLIEPHVVKAIGDGNSISIWRDNWIPKATNRTLTGPATKETAEYTVSDLFKEGTKEWDIGKIQLTCPEMENEILGLHPSVRGAKDSYQWLHSISGVYSSKSGYYIKANKEDTLTCFPRTTQPINWIKDIWAQVYSPKLKIFIWKIIHKALPIGENLQSRGMGQNANCIRCNQLETAKHLFFECPFAKSLWEKAPLIRNLKVTENDSFEQTLLQGAKLTPLPPTGVGGGPLFPWLCWTLWTARNQLVFQNRKFSWEDCITKAVKEAAEWGSAQNSDSTTKTALLPQKTRQSRIPGICYLMTDAAWKETTLEAGIAWIINEPEAAICTRGSRKVKFVTDPLTAEAMAIRAGLQVASQKGISSIQVLSDSLALISAIKAKEEIRSIYGIMADIQSFSSDFSNIDFIYIPRSENREADSLAKDALITTDHVVLPSRVCEAL